MNPARIAFAAGALFAASVVLSSIHPWGNLRSGVKADTPLLEGSAVPDEVRHVLETKCADCHSTNTDWPLYSRLAPGSWLVEHDVNEGRNHLNMSQWQRYSLETRIDLLSKIASEARSGQMPVRQYLILHPKARLSSEEQQLIYDWAKAERKQIRQQIEGLRDKRPAN
jgi:cytochrome c